MKKIKVLQFPIGNNRGGITQYVLKNWQYIDKERFIFDFASMHEVLDFESELTKNCSKVYHIRKYAEDNTELFKEQFREILKNEYDIVHLHTSYWKSFAAEEVAREMKVPKIIIHAHSTSIDVMDAELRQKSMLCHNKLKKLISNNYATDFWTCSGLAGDWLYGDQIPKEQVKLMRNAINVKDFKYDETIRKRIRNELGLDGFVIGHIGRFTYQKNHEFIIHVFHEILRKNPESMLLLVGVGPNKESIIELAEELDVIKKIIFLEKIDNVNEVMQAMDTFILPSYFEGFPIVLVEAQATGMKCLASSCITSEIKIVDDLMQLPLEKCVWVEALLEIANGYQRSEVSEQISDAGYELEDAVRYLERKYMENLSEHRL